MIKDMTDDEFELFSDYIRKNFGIIHTKGKKTLLESRVRLILNKKGLKSYEEYYRILLNDYSGEENKLLINKITTNHTFFMREEDHFDYFKDTILPFLEQTVKNKDLRIWCAGCSSGEESYTLAMLINDYFENKLGWNTEILATDISTEILERAIKGVYKKDSLETLYPNWKDKYFKQVGKDSFEVIKSLKDKITYREFNLLTTSFPFKEKFQVIFCRNVMIYFDNEIRKKIIKKFYDSSMSGAYLLIGHSETINNLNTNYNYIKPAIYRK